MNKTRVIAFVAAALVAGLALGTITSAWAAGPAAGTTGSANAVVNGVCGLGLKLGATVRDAGGRLADVVAKLTGLSATDVQEKRAAGESFTSIAKAEGVSSSAVVDEALKVRSQVLDAQVKAGTITQTQADAALAQMKTRLQERIDSTTAGCTGTGGGGMGRMGGGGRGAGRGAGCGSCATAAGTTSAQ